MGKEREKRPHCPLEIFRSSQVFLFNDGRKEAFLLAEEQAKIFTNAEKHPFVKDSDKEEERTKSRQECHIIYSPRGKNPSAHPEEERGALASGKEFQF